MNVQPLGNRVLIEPVTATENTGGIFIPDTAAKNKPTQGTVIALGSKIDRVKIGDHVLLAQYGYSEISIEGKEYYLAGEDNILAIIGD